MSDTRGGLAPERIAEHNARVRAIWEPIDAAIGGLERATLEEVARLGRDEGLAMNSIAQRMRGKVGIDWGADYDVGVGTRLYQRALVVLDLYDADFRPQPGPVEVMRSEANDGTGLVLEMHYHPTGREFQVAASRSGDTRHRRFRANRAPRFGMDASDHAQATEIAEQLATEIETGAVPASAEQESTDMDRIEINPETDALLVIDMQPDFMEGGALAVPGGLALIDGVNDILARFARRYATKDWHGRGHKSFAANHVDPATGQAAPDYSLTTMPYGEQRLWPVHCVQGTPGAELHPDLRADLIGRVVLKGWRDEVDSYSAFLENDGETKTEMADVLRADGVRRIFVVGLTRPYCVDFTALDGTRLGFETYVVSDLSGELGTREELDASRARLEAEGVRFVIGDMLAPAPAAGPAL